MGQTRVSDVVYVLLALAAAATAVANPAVNTLSTVLAAIAAAVSRMGRTVSGLAAVAAALSVAGSGIAFSYVADGAHYALIGSYLTTLASLLLAYSVIRVFGGKPELRLYILGASLVLASLPLVPYSLPPQDIASMAAPGITAVIAYSPALAVAAAGNAFTALSVALTARPRAR